MRVAIMQPYLFPYIGYFQLIGAVDLFIIYDNIKYTKKGWINRNRLLQSGRDVMFSLPLKSASDSLDVCQRELAASFDRASLLNQVAGAYRRAPHFAETFALVERCIGFADSNLFRFLHHALIETCRHLDIGTDVRISSDVDIDHDLKGQERVLAMCSAVGASTYINAIGGLDLYADETFRARGIDLKFLRARRFEYAQFENEFVPWLSIIDVMMFNPRASIACSLLGDFDLIAKPEVAVLSA